MLENQIVLSGFALQIQQCIPFDKNYFSQRALNLQCRVKGHQRCEGLWEL
jgi:hypothetical protein